jgi:hypothetical protein
MTWGLQRRGLSKGFRSLTMYDPEIFLVPNFIDRYRASRRAATAIPPDTRIFQAGNQTCQIRSGQSFATKPNCGSVVKSVSS